MSFAIRYTRKAEADVRRIVTWFETRAVDSGERFRQSLSEAAEELARNATIYRVRERGLRRMAVPRFEHYGIFYRILGNDVEIAAVIHGSRHPGRLRLREDPPS